MSVIRGSVWLNVCIASNNKHLWLWINPGINNVDMIEIYSTQFQCMRTIKFGEPILYWFRRGTSFAMTDDCVATINSRRSNNLQVVQINIFSLDMQPIKSQDLGTCTDLVQIRTDGMNRFFVTTGQTKIHMVMAGGKKEIIYLSYVGNSIAVLNSKRFVVGDSNQDVELIQLLT
ncbi:unnamed protein product [Rotaria sp. Silwood2]|nr:unnamed protein product [Rotaria sp. Silwood2]CAF2847159.1 unnamed protein product [Rotaria sp. Silwood2]CAF3049421.1 unnamed protein product [Rotaria sp. Silwood2]CAF3210214.1 unnamed protein product [Rotaria sp. Silwood2]CAF4394009.1 unnamed protein product [Rotaria sp. Silwood2]